jgi:hypothetical protein
MAVLGFEFRELLCHLNYASSPFALVVVIGSHIFACASLVHDPPIYISHKAGMSGTHHHAQLFSG